MASPLYIIQAWDAASGRPFFHETAVGEMSIADVARNIVDHNHGDFRIDAVRRFDPATEHLTNITAETMQAVVDHCIKVGEWLPDYVEDAVRSAGIPIYPGLLRTYHLDAAE